VNNVDLKMHRATIKIKKHLLLFSTKAPDCGLKHKKTEMHKKGQEISRGVQSQKV
jgi:hypothetical protein